MYELGRSNKKSPVRTSTCATIERARWEFLILGVVDRVARLPLASQIKTLSPYVRGVPTCVVITWSLQPR